MKKLLFTAFSVAFGMSSFAQTQVEAPVKVNLNKADINYSAEAVTAVNDSIFFPVTNNPDCITGPYIWGGNLFGTRAIGTGAFSEIGQYMNTAGRDVNVHSLVFLTLEKEAGNNPGSFAAGVYDSTSFFGPNPTLAATSTPVTFANVDTAAGWTTFSFATPVNVSEPFVASLEVDNGSDSISIGATNSYCGIGGAFFEIADTSWSSYAGSFINQSQDPLNASIWVFAEVDTATSGIGLESNFIHNEGLNFYPNPATNNATIEYAINGEDEVTLIIQNMAGQQVYSKSYSVSADQKIDLDLESFQEGVYTYQVIGKRKQLNGVFIKK